MNHPGSGDGGVGSSPDGADADGVRIVPAEAVAAPDGTPLAKTRVVGLGSGFFVDFDFDHPDHTFREMIDDGWYGRHDPAGAWYCGADLSVHPDYRGRGLARRLYDARKAVVRRHRKRGIVAGGAPCPATRPTATRARSRPSAGGAARWFADRPSSNVG